MRERDYTEEEWDAMLAELASTPVASVFPEPPAPPANPYGVPQASDVEVPPILQHGQPSARQSPAPAQMQIPERPKVGPTTMDRVGLTLAALSTGLQGAANRLGNRPQAPSGAGQAYARGIREDIASRTSQANLEHRERVANMFRAEAEKRAQAQAAQQAELTDPNSAASERAWRAAQAMRMEAGLPPIDPSHRANFTAADAKGWLLNTPTAMGAKVAQRQTEAAAQRKQEQQATSAQEQLRALQAAGIDLTGIDTSDPAAVDKVFQLKRDELQGERALQRARVMGPRGEGGTAAALPQGTPTASEMMGSPQSIQDALTDIDRQMDQLGTDKGADALYKRLQQRRDKLVEMDQYTLPGMKFTKTPTKTGYEQASNLMTVRNDMQRIAKAAQEANIEGVDQAVLAKIGEYSGAITPDWLKSQFPQLHEADDLAQRLGRLKQVIASSIIVKKNEAELGAITGADMGLVHDMLGNPTGMLELASGRGMQSLENAVGDIEASYPDKMAQYGYAPAESQAGPGTDKVRQELEALSDEELMRIAGEGG